MKPTGLISLLGFLFYIFITTTPTLADQGNAVGVDGGESARIIYPKDVKDWTQYNKNNLSLIQKSVDGGAQPWLASAEDYAATFVETYYGLKGEDTGLLPDGQEIKVGERSAIVEFYYKGKKHLVELDAPIKPHSKGGIWIVKKMTIFDPSFATAATYRTAHIEKRGDSYEVSADYPQFKDPNIQERKANKAIKRFVRLLFDKDVKGFIAAKYSKEEIRGSVNPDSIDVSFKVVFLNKDRISIYFEKDYFGLGAMHPVHNSFGFNYDLRHNKVIKLADLFKPGTPYLKQISDFCIKEFEGMDQGGGLTGWIKDGASAKEKNLGEFTFNKDSLTIYFSDYQVASGAVGLQSVRIPINNLSGWVYE